MLKINRLIILLCFLGCAVMVRSLVAQENAIDAIQNFKIMRVEEIVSQHDKMLVTISEKMTYTQGGVAGIYAVLGIIGLFNLKLISKK